jgi:uncharacterized repeat protein (TIGR01451 family)
MMVDPATGLVVSPPATGTPDLLDKWTVTKPEVRSKISVKLTASSNTSGGGEITYTVQLNNDSQIDLNGTQVRLHLPKGLRFAGTASDSATVQGNEVVVTIGHLAAGSSQDVSIQVKITGGQDEESGAFAEVTSSTARPIFSNSVSMR